jgi:hypothetical protein
MAQVAIQGELNGKVVDCMEKIHECRAREHAVDSLLA